MPITQQRLHRITLAARAYKDLWQQQQEDIREAFEREPHSAALADLYSAMARQVIPADYAEAIVREEEHYKHTSRQNVRRKLHMRRVRSGSHVPQAQPKFFPDKDLAQAVEASLTQSEWGVTPGDGRMQTDADIGLLSQVPREEQKEQKDGQCGEHEEGNSMQSADCQVVEEKI